MNEESPSLTTPESVPHAFAAAWNDRDPDRLAELFEADAEFVNVAGLWWHDREAIRKAHAYGLAHIFNRSTLSVTTVRSKLLTPDIAVVHAKMHLTGQTPAHGIARPGARTTIFSFVMRNSPEGWRCASAHNTDIVPGKETNIMDEQGRLQATDYSGQDQ